MGSASSPSGILMEAGPIFDAMFETAPSVVVEKVDPATVLPVADRVIAEIGLILAVHLAIALAATAAVQAFSAF